MSDDKKVKRLTLDSPSSLTTFTLRDLDNAQPLWKPKGIRLDNPRLAPPGMSGIKMTNHVLRRDIQTGNLNVRVSVQVSEAQRGPPKPIERPKPFLGQQGEVSRAFTPIVRTPIKDRGWER